MEEEYIPYYTFSFIKCFITEVSDLSKELLESDSIPPEFKETLENFTFIPVSSKTERIISLLGLSLNTQEMLDIEEIINAND